MSIWQTFEKNSGLSDRLVLPYQSCCSNLINPGNPKKCECNGHKNVGGAGECNGVHPVATCNGGHWCYVDDDAQCMEANPGKNSPFRWTCEACLGEYIGSLGRKQK